ncbi:MAG: transposase [Chloroflexi bacterium]|nr:transposase [Chloroflexota bacterium]
MGWESRCLTDAQWLLLQETFLFLHDELDSSRKYRRRKPLPADRILLEGILWKLAGGLRWQDLPDDYPVRLCQDLYSALYRTGHMHAIYKQLHWHLNVYGEATLDELVERGCFVIAGNRVQLSPSEDLTWEKYTALLLLQQAFRARRAIQREADLERRRRGNFYRLPSLRIPGVPRRRIDRGVPEPGHGAYWSEPVSHIKPPPHLESNLLERKIPGIYRESSCTTGYCVNI